MQRQTTVEDDVAACARRGIGLGALRKHRRLTQTALADQIGIAQPTLSHIESLKDLRVSTIVRYARWLDNEVDVQIVLRYDAVQVQ